jgi:hypothetical protein
MFSLSWQGLAGSWQQFKKQKKKHPIGRYNIFKKILIFSPSKS